MTSNHFKMIKACLPWNFAQCHEKNIFCLFFAWILNWLFSFLPCLSPTLLIFLVRQKPESLFFLLQLYSWDVVLLSKYSLNYRGIFSQFALSKSKSHLNPSKHCTIASPAVFFVVILNFNIALRKSVTNVLPPLQGPLIPFMKCWGH